MGREKDQGLDHGVQTLAFILSDAGGHCRGPSPGVARGLCLEWLTLCCVENSLQAGSERRTGRHLEAHSGIWGNGTKGWSELGMVGVVRGGQC